MGGSSALGFAGIAALLGGAVGGSVGRCPRCARCSCSAAARSMLASMSLRSDSKFDTALDTIELSPVDQEDDDMGARVCSLGLDTLRRMAVD
jgi:hypothetical protein